MAKQRRIKRRKQLSPSRFFWVLDGEGNEVQVWARKVYCSDYFFCVIWQEKSWRDFIISEIRTGVTVGKGKTRDEAVSNAREYLDTPSHKSIREKILKAPLLSCMTDNRYRKPWHTQLGARRKKDD